MERSRLLLLLGLAQMVAKADGVDDGQPTATVAPPDPTALLADVPDGKEPEQEPDGDEDEVEAEQASATLIVSKSTVVAKAWGVPQGAIIEGWVSTEDPDQDNDVVPVEAFASSLPSYAARRMPLSSEHAMHKYPVGHGQRLALVKDGQVISQATHPADPADFEHLPSTGSGVYGRFLITEPDAARAVANGNIGGFSWIGKAHYEPRATGRGRIFRRVDPWMECTIAAYPRNIGATVVAAKPL